MQMEWSGSRIVCLDSRTTRCESRTASQTVQGQASLEDRSYARSPNGKSVERSRRFDIDFCQLNRVEFAHSRGVILRDIKPENFAMGVGEKSRIVYLFDFGLAKLYVDPSTGVHIPYREGREVLGTMPYSSYNVHFGRGS
jgi:serine/threonine protein kinase